MAGGDILSAMDTALAATTMITLTPAAGVGYAITALYASASDIRVWGANSNLEVLIGVSQSVNYSSEFRRQGCNLKILVSNTAPFSFKNIDSSTHYYGYSMVVL